MNILLTGGCGYIGSHTAIALTAAGHQVTLLDNFSNSKEASVKSIESILNKKIYYRNVDIQDTHEVKKILLDRRIEAVIHLAGLKSVTESLQVPIQYYKANVQGVISLLDAMNDCGIYDLVFSSSAAVYGNPKYLPINEDHPLSPVNPYGKTKLIIEEMLNDLCASDPQWSIICLRYFNPVGGHESGLLGDNPGTNPSNLMPYISLVATGIHPYVMIQGSDYETLDGSGIRDFIHVMDLADGHLSALDALRNLRGWTAFNLGTGRGCSVLEMIKKYQETCSVSIPYKNFPRRIGDVPICYADVSKAHSILKWRAKRNLMHMCQSQHKWQLNNNQEIKFS